MKKFISILLSVLMLTSVTAGLDLTAYADTSETYTDGYYSYTVTDGKATITDCDTSISGDIEIPSTIGDNYPVTCIGWYAFEDCTGLTSVIIPDSVTNICGHAFRDCTGLTRITIPDSVTNIRSSAFNNTGYYNESSNWDDDVLYIGNYLIDAYTYISGDYSIKGGTKIIAEEAFYHCENLTSVTVPDSVLNISYHTFGKCTDLTNVTIGNSVASIDKLAFYDCTSLTNITVSENNQCYSSQDGVLFNKDKTELIKYPIGNTSTSYTIPDSVISISDSAFEYCTGLTSVTIPDSVTNIGNFAFYGCGNITDLTLGKGVKSIGAGAFTNESYSEGSGEGETYVVRPIPIENVYYNGTASDWCQITFGDTPVYDKIYINGAEPTSITIENVDKINANAFKKWKSLEEVTISSGVTSIGEEAFYKCTSLTNVTIGNGVTSIGKDAFSGCDSLTKTNYTGTIEQWAQIDFKLSSDYEYVYCNSNPIKYSKNLYINDELVTDAVLTSATKINAFAFSDCESLTSITIPDSVTSIGENAFSNCTGLTSITIPDSVTSIGEEAFYKCTSLTNVTIGNSVTNFSRDSYGNYYNSFYGCTNLTEITYAYGTTDITSAVPSQIKNSLTTVNIPDTVTYVGDSAFVGCSKIESITIPQSVTRIEYNAFSGLTNITIKGYSNSYAETYAKWTGIPFVALDDGNSSTPVNPVSPSTDGNSSSNAGDNTSTSTNTGSNTSTNAGNSGTTSSGTGSTVEEIPDDCEVVGGEYISSKLKKPTIKKVTKGKKKITVQWKKVSGVSGYQVQVATDKKFKKNKKTVNIKKQKTTKTTVKKLKSKKKYYVRVRTYKTVNGKKIYSNWSKVKTVKTK